MSDENSGKHDVWNRLNQQSDQIAHIAKGQASTDARLASLESKFDEGFRSLNIAMNRLTERASQPTNWIGFGSMAVSMVTVMAGFVILVTSPMSKTMDQMTELIRDNRDRTELKIESIQSSLENRAFRIGKLEESVRHLEQQNQLNDSRQDIERARNADIEERVARTEGRHEMLVDRVKDIDDKGSRKWNSDSPVQ